MPWDLTASRSTRAPWLLWTAACENRNYYNRKIWKPALPAADMEPTRENGMHALRQHFASVLLDGGVSTRALAEYLGHSDPGFTLRVYAHLMPTRGPCPRRRRRVSTASR